MENLGFFSRPDLQNAGKELFSYMQQLVSSGKESEAKTLYNDKQREYGFTDADFSQFADTGERSYNGRQIGEWKVNPATTPLPVQLSTQQQQPLASQVPQVTTTSAPDISYGGISANNAYDKLLSGDVNLEPYNKMYDAAAGRLTNQFNTQVLPGIGQGAQAAGQYGGSRQGIAQGLATQGLNNSLSDLAANTYLPAYQQAQTNMANAAGQIGNFGLQDYANNTNRIGTIGGLQIGQYNADTNRFGTIAGAQNNFMNTQMNAANGAANLGLSANNYPWQQLQNYSQIANSSGGMGNSSSAPIYSNPYGGAIAGAVAAGSLYK